MRVLQSQTDLSTNFVEQSLEGFLESRYVRRNDKYFVCYLSSHNGCKRGCRMCHLTATKQTMFVPATLADYFEQAKRVFAHYRDAVRTGEQKPAQYMHYAFMARGEPMSNLHVHSGLLRELGELAIDHELPAKFCVSTIMPRTLSGAPLIQRFGYIQPTIYWSLYSVREEFREKWLPGAMGATDAFDRLSEYQDHTKKLVKIHFAFIAGENDSEAEIASMCYMLETWKLYCEINIVRYNPASPVQGRESSEDVIQARAAQLSQCPMVRAVKIVPRVGFDVKASCGMFVQGGK